MVPEREDFERVDGLGIKPGREVVLAHAAAPSNGRTAPLGRSIAAFAEVGDTPDVVVGIFAATPYPPRLEPAWPGPPVTYPSVAVEAPVSRAPIATLTSISTLTSVAAVLLVERRSTYVDNEAHNAVGEIAGFGGGQVGLGGHYNRSEGSCV